MKVLKALGLLGVGLLGLVVLVWLGARFHDGPLAMFPGGPLEAGALVETPVTDWGFAASVSEIEMQLADDTTSRTVWIVTQGKRAFIPCSLRFPPGKRWHQRAVKDGRAYLRIEGKRYPVELRRLEGAIPPELEAVMIEKYGSGPPGDGTWLFEVAYRTG